MVTPLTFSPFIMTHWSGAAPRYIGRSDACTFTHPYLGSVSTLTGRSCPNATTTITSGASFLSSSRNSSFFLTLSGWNTGISCFTASALTGVIRNSFPLPLGLSGCVTTAATSCPASNSALRVPTAKPGVPIKTTLIYSSSTFCISYSFCCPLPTRCQQAPLQPARYKDDRQDVQAHGR